MSGTSSKFATLTLRPGAPLERVEHLLRRALAADDGALQVALEVLGGVLAGEVARAGDLRLGAAEARVLARLVVRVGAERPRVRGPVVERRATVPLLREARQDRLDLLEEPLRAVAGRAVLGAERVADLATRVVDEDPGGPRLGARDLPRGLVAGVGVRLAVVAQAAPVPRLEADVELGVGAHRQLADRARLARVEAGLGEVDGAQHRERQREHDPVGRDARRGRALLERERVAPARGEPDRDELGALRDLPVQRGGHRLHELVVAAADVELLVGGSEQPQLALARVAEQIEQVERALLGALGAELDGVGDVEQLPEARRAPAGHALLDPLRDRHRVQLPPARRGDRIRGRIRRGRDVLMDLLIDGVVVLGGLRERVRTAVEVIQRLGAVGLGLEQVVQRQVQLLGQLTELDVARVDQLAAVLGDEPGRERAADRPAAPAEAVAALVQLRSHPRAPETVGARQPREASPDDDYSAVRRGSGARRPRGDGDRGRAGGPEQLTTAERDG